MSISKPTRARAFGLRIVAPQGEQWHFFGSMPALARDLALRLHKATYRVYHRASIGARVPIAILDIAGASASHMRQTPYQAEHTHFGSTWRVRTDWTSYEVFDRNGHPLQVQKVLSTFDLKGYLTRHHKWQVQHCDRGHGPVPHVSKSRGGLGWLRYIRTAQEIRLSALVLTEYGEIPTRAARNMSNLPTYWEDIRRNPQRSWKEQRKTRKQWMRRK
jgi:hypothetical protein